MISDDNTDVDAHTKPSSTGANPDIPGFSDKNLEKHFGSNLESDHSQQYTGFTKEQYAQRAVELARSPVGNGIEGYKSARGKFAGSIVRYDSSTNDWVRAYIASGVATMFKPDEGAEYFEFVAKMEMED